VNHTRLYKACSDIVYNKLKADVLLSVKNLIPDLLNHFKVLFYNGNFDLKDGPMGTEKYLHDLQWPGQAEYLLSERLQWKVNGSIAGYVKTAKNLIFITIVGAGHFVPMDQPQHSLDMLDRFTNKSSIFCYDCISQSTSFCMLLSNCSNHGTCSQGKCLCNSNYYGRDCSREYFNVNKNRGTIQTATLQPLEFNFFDFTTEGSCQVIELDADSTCLFLRQDKPPTELLFDIADCTNITGFQLITLNTYSGQHWYIGTFNYDTISRQYTLHISACSNLGLVIGIVVAVVVGCVILFYAVYRYFFFYRKRKYEQIQS